MDLSAISSLASLSGVTSTSGTSSIASMLESSFKNSELVSRSTEDSNMFQTMLNSAMDNINTTNEYLSQAENEQMLFALGESESTHDLSIALQKASTSLQYTIAVRDKLLEAYKEIMQMQI